MYKLKLHRDDNPSDPREWDNLGTMVCFHHNYNLGDEQPRSDPQEWLRDLACSLDETLADRLYYWEEGAGWERQFNKALAQWDSNLEKIRDELALAKLCYTPEATDHCIAKLNTEYRRELTSKWKESLIAKSDEMISEMIWKVLDKHVVMLPLYLYDHSGLSMSVGGFSCPWDSGQVGYIYASREDILQEYGGKRLTRGLRERAERLLKAEVEEYDRFLCGDAWGWVVYEVDDDCDCEPDEECDCTDGADHVESCWGYLGSEAALEDGKASLEWLEKNKESE